MHLKVLYMFSPRTAQTVASLMDIETWNTNTLWRDEFGTAAKELVFFAEDAFGDQFAISQGKHLSI